MTSQLQMVEEAKIPGENHCLTQVTGIFLKCPNQDPNSGGCERQIAVSGNALDYTAIRAGPQW